MAALLAQMEAVGLGFDPWLLQDAGAVRGASSRFTEGCLRRGAAQWACQVQPHKACGAGVHWRGAAARRLSRGPASRCARLGAQEQTPELLRASRSCGQAPQLPRPPAFPCRPVSPAGAGVRAVPVPTGKRPFRPALQACSSSMARIEEEAAAVARRPFNLSSPQQLADVLYGDLRVGREGPCREKGRETALAAEMSFSSCFCPPRCF